MARSFVSLLPICSAWRAPLGLTLLLAFLGLPNPAQAQNVGLASQIALGCQFPTITDALLAAVAGDTVLVAQGITLTESVTVDLDVAIRSATTACTAASVPGAPRPELVAPANQRVFHIEAGHKVVLKQLSIADGQAGPGFGGNILVEPGANLLLDDVQVWTGGALRGGGIYVRGGVLRLRNRSALYLNYAEEGAGIYIEDGVLSVLDSNIQFNGATFDGGGIYAQGASVEITQANIGGNGAARDGAGLFLDSVSLVSQDVFLAHNSAKRDGGGLFARQSTLDIDLGEVSHNRADGNGGGLYTDSTDITRLSTSVGHNRADLDGGGWAVVDDSGPSTSLIDGVELFENTALQDGGGVFARGIQSTVILDGDATIYENEAGRNGGGAALQDHVQWIGAELVVARNEAPEGSGGGLHIEGAVFESANAGEFIDNEASQGGGIAIACTDSNQPRVVLEQVLIARNNATGDGGGVAMWNSAGPPCELSLVRGDLFDNSANAGGGIAIWGSTLLNTSELWAHGNTAMNGGGVAALDDGVFNSTPEVRIVNDSTTIAPCEHRSLGPDQYCSEIRDNYATLGGGMYLEDAIVTVEQVGLLGNDATVSGAAIHLAENVTGSGSADVLLANAVLADNNPVSTSDIVYAGNGNALHATSLSFGLNVGAPLHWDAGSTGSLFNSAVSDTTPIAIDPALGALPGNCNAVNSVLGPLGGAFVSGMVFGDFATSPTRGRFQADLTTPMLLDTCNDGLTEDIDRNTRPGGLARWDRGAFEAP